MRGDFGFVGPLLGLGQAWVRLWRELRRAEVSSRLCICHYAYAAYGGVPAMSNSDGYAFGPKGELGEAGLRRPWATPVVIVATKASGTDKLTVSGTFDHFYPVLSTTVGPPS